MNQLATNDGPVGAGFLSVCSAALGFRFAAARQKHEPLDALATARPTRSSDGFGGAGHCEVRIIGDVGRAYAFQRESPSCRVLPVEGGVAEREPIRTGIPFAVSLSATRRPVLPVPPTIRISLECSRLESASI